MPDGNWGVRFAIIGAALGLAAYAFQVGVGIGELSGEPEAYPAYQEARQDDAGADTAASGNVEPLRYKQPCRDPQGQDESDLCAQYRAANAASDAAYWAKWQLWLSVFGVLGLAGTIMLTVRATNAAVESNRIASDTAKLQLRAYLEVSKIVLEPPVVGEHLTCRVEFTNMGQTPAHHVCANVVISIVPKGIVHDFPIHPPDEEQSRGTLGRDNPLFVTVQSLEPADEPGLADMRSGAITVFIHGRIDYSDIFGAEHRVLFRTRYIPGSGFAQCSEGNATD